MRPFLLLMLSGACATGGVSAHDTKTVAGNDTSVSDPVDAFGCSLSAEAEPSPDKLFEEDRPGDTSFERYTAAVRLLESGKHDDGLDALRNLAGSESNSPYSDEAWFRIGRFWFHDRNDAHKALQAFRRAAQNPKSVTSVFATHRQGWCHQNLADWSLALKQFRTVVSLTEDCSVRLDAETRAELHRSATEDATRAADHVEPGGQRLP